MADYDEDDVRPQAVRELFDGSSDLTLKTEVPPRMIIPLLRMKIVLEAHNPRRTKPLVQIFREEYMRLMVSLKRRGRLELLGALRVQSEVEDIDEGQL